jgi:hypothetical protein
MGTERPPRPDPNAAAKGPFFMDEFVVGSHSVRDACAYLGAGSAFLDGRLRRGDQPCCSESPRESALL